MNERQYFHFGCQQTKYKKSTLLLGISVDFAGTIYIFPPRRRRRRLSSFPIFPALFVFYLIFSIILQRQSRRSAFKKFVREPNTNVTLLINIGCAQDPLPIFRHPPSASCSTSSAGWTTQLDSKDKHQRASSWVSGRFGPRTRMQRRQRRMSKWQIAGKHVIFMVSYIFIVTLSGRNQGPCRTQVRVVLSHFRGSL